MKARSRRQQPQTSEKLPEQLLLSREESLVLALLQYRMMRLDISETRFSKTRTAKRGPRDEFRDGLVEVITALRDERPGGSVPELDAPVSDYVQKLAELSGGSLDYELFVGGPDLASGVVKSRSRSLLILINLYAFQPWGREAWVRTVRRKALADFASRLPDLHATDLDHVRSEFAKVLRSLRLQNVPWLKVAILVAGGVGLGVLTAGLAAPVLGGAVGAAMGYTGVVATSAGLAALGGGSLAAGGFGMAGGSVVLAGLGGLTGAGMAAGTGRITGFTFGQVAADAVLLLVVTRLVLIETEGDDEAARKVAESLHQRVSDLEALATDLVETIDRLRSELKSAERSASRDQEEVDQLKADLKIAKEQQDQMTLSQRALVLVDNRLATSR